MAILRRPADPRTWAARAAVQSALRAQSDAARAGQLRSSYDFAAWGSVVAFAAYVVLALSGAGGRALSVTFPVGCLFVALFTYVRSPSTYLQFTWWAWLLTPFVRRVFDMRYGFHTTSPLLLGPVLATTVAFLTLVRHRRMLRSPTYLPFIIAIVELLYAYCIGVIRQSVTAATYDLLLWGAPLAFGMHLSLSWRQYPRMRATMVSMALWGMLVTSLYGIWQFARPPIWDRTWMVSAEMYSIGIPSPFLLRVFSTLNAPGPFATVLIFTLLLGLSAPQRWRLVPLALGIVALLLTKGRSAWGAFVVGALIMQLRQPIRTLPRQWVLLIGVLLLAAPAIVQPRIFKAVSARAASLQRLEADNSYQSRAGLTRYVLHQVATNPVGSGLGQLGGASKLLTGSRVGLAFDNGLLEVFGLMGWIGGMLYSMALIALLLTLLRDRFAARDPIVSASSAIVCALLASALFGNVFNGVSGFIFWSAVGLTTAGRTFAIAAEMSRRYANHPGLPAARTLPTVAAA